MEREVRQRLERLTQQARQLLEQEYREQLEGRFDILLDGRIPLAPGAHLSAPERIEWSKLVAAIAHKRSRGTTSADAVAAYLREAAFHTLNRFVALKVLEARKLVQECISRAEDSSGFKEFTGLAPGLAQLPDKGYRLYIDSLFDEIGRGVRVLFDRRDAASLLWPRRQALGELLGILNDEGLSSVVSRQSSAGKSSVVSRRSSAGDSGLTTDDRRPTTVWDQDETIGWVYQYFNGGDERRQMRAESQAPRNSRELAVRNQFFTPRYVVQFLVDNSLGQTWCEMSRWHTSLAELDYMVATGERPERKAKDPRDLRVIDPACGSGHFLLYAFDLFAGNPDRGIPGIYEEAWRGGSTPPSELTGRTLTQDYESIAALQRAIPDLILSHNLHGVDIDPRAAQIAALSLWVRAQKAFNTFDISASERPTISRTNIVTAEPMPGDREMIEEFASTLSPRLTGELFRRMVEAMRLAGELGPLLRIEALLANTIAEARAQFAGEGRGQASLTGLETPSQSALDLSDVSDAAFFDSIEEHILNALASYLADAVGARSVRRRLFANDSEQGIAFIDLCRKRYDVVLMNPPFGAVSKPAKKAFDAAYPRTKNDVYAAFVERGIELLHPDGFLGAITSRTGFFLSSFQKWREEILLKEAPPTVFADLGHGVLDSAMVEVAAYCLRKGANP